MTLEYYNNILYNIENNEVMLLTLNLIEYRRYSLKYSCIDQLISYLIKFVSQVKQITNDQLMLLTLILV